LGHKTRGRALAGRGWRSAGGRCRYCGSVDGHRAAGGGGWGGRGSTAWVGVCVTEGAVSG